MRNAILLFAGMLILATTQAANAGLGGIWLPNCDELPSTKSSPPMLLIAPIYFDDSYQFYMCLGNVCIVYRHIATPTKIYGDKRFADVSDTIFTLAKYNRNPEITYKRCDGMNKEYHQLLQSYDLNASRFIEWKADYTRKRELEEEVSRVDYTNPVDVVRTWFRAVQNEEYDFIPYLAAPEYVYGYLPETIRNLRLNIRLPKATVYTLKFEDNKSKAVVGIDGTEYWMTLRRQKNKWMIESNHNMKN